MNASDKVRKEIYGNGKYLKRMIAEGKKARKRDRKK